MTDAEFAPICTVLAGPNGSGKSSAARNWLNVPGEIVNADVIARLIKPEQPEAASRAAGRAVLKRLDELVEQRQNFNFETTLSSQQALRTLAHHCRRHRWLSQAAACLGPGTSEPSLRKRTRSC